MTKSSESAELVGVMTAGDAARRKLSPFQLRLRIAAGVLGLLESHCALFLFIAPWRYA